MVARRIEAGEGEPVLLLDLPVHYVREVDDHWIGLLVGEGEVVKDSSPAIELQLCPLLPQHVIDISLEKFYNTILDHINQLVVRYEIVDFDDRKEGEDGSPK